MLLAPVIYNMCTGVDASHVFLWNNLCGIRRALVHHRFRIRVIIRVQCALHHFFLNDVNLKFCRDRTHSPIAHSWGLCTLVYTPRVCEGYGLHAMRALSNFHVGLSGEGFLYTVRPPRINSLFRVTSLIRTRVGQSGLFFILFFILVYVHVHTCT